MKNYDSIFNRKGFDIYHSKGRTSYIKDLDTLHIFDEGLEMTLIVTPPKDAGLFELEVIEKDERNSFYYNSLKVFKSSGAKILQLCEKLGQNLKQCLLSLKALDLVSKEVNLSVVRWSVPSNERIDDHLRELKND